MRKVLFIIILESGAWYENRVKNSVKSVDKNKNLVIPIASRFFHFFDYTLFYKKNV